MWFANIIGVGCVDTIYKLFGDKLGVGELHMQPEATLSTSDKCNWIKVRTMSWLWREWINGLRWVADNIRIGSHLTPRYNTTSIRKVYFPRGIVSIYNVIPST